MGRIIGEALDLEGRLQSLGDKIQASLGKRVKGSLASGFVYTTLIYCVGPMAILGALQGGLEGEHGILYAKSAIDGITAIAFASTLGPGVILSGISVLLYQGLLALGSQLLAEVRHGLCSYRHRGHIDWHKDIGTQGDPVQFAPRTSGGLLAWGCSGHPALRLNLVRGVVTLLM